MKNLTVGNAIENTELLTVDEVGLLLGGEWDNVRRINNQLVVEGFQFRDNYGNWVITEKGKPHAVFFGDIAKSTSYGMPVEPLKWRKSIVNEMALEAA
jgi:hypothetical protein